MSRLNLLLLCVLALYAAEPAVAAGSDYCLEMYLSSPDNLARCEKRRLAAEAADNVAAAEADKPVDEGEPCSTLRKRNSGASWGGLVALPLRCVPMKDRVPKVYPLSTFLKGMSCLNNIYRDRQGNAGRVCGPVVEVYRKEHFQGCLDDESAMGVSASWKTGACRGVGTGALHCDDGRVAVDTGNDGRSDCSLTVQEHVPPISAPE